MTSLPIGDVSHISGTCVSCPVRASTVNSVVSFSECWAALLMVGPWGDAMARIVETTVNGVTTVELEGKPSLHPRIPLAFVCPLSGNVFREPVVCEDGNTYERVWMERWLSDHDYSPLTGAPMGQRIMLPNTNLRIVIDDFLQRHPGIIP